jgi:hypothetical protein
MNNEAEMTQEGPHSQDAQLQVEILLFVNSKLMLP